MLLNSVEDVTELAARLINAVPEAKEGKPDQQITRDLLIASVGLVATLVVDFKRCADALEKIAERRE